MASRNVLFLLAHQDDEYFIAPFILRERSRGNSISCVYLTDGSSYGIDPDMRNKESLRALLSLGVKEREVMFLGSALGFKDSTAMMRCQEIFEALREHLKNIAYSRIYCPAWEGGHIDHDATHLVALAFAKYQGLLAKTWQFSLYNSYLAPGRFFRVMSPIQSSTHSYTENMTIKTAIKCAFLFRYYPSQWRTWLGLSPEAVTKIILFRRMTIHLVSIQKVFRRPHKAPLLYETRFHVHYDDFVRRTNSFRYQHLSNDSEI